MKYILSLPFFLVYLISCTTEPKQQEETTPDFCAAIHGDSLPHLSEKLAPFDSLMKHLTGVFPLENGDEAMITRAWLSENAEKTIDVQYFIFSLDNVGLIAVDYLVRAADRGIKVRILVDDILIDADEEKLLTLAAHKNITIKIYNPVMNIGKTFLQKVKNLKDDFRGSNQRMHNKTFIVDSKVVITGGRNIADEYFDYDHEYNFRDRDVLLLGGITDQVENSFNTFWNNPLCKDVTSILDTGTYKINAEAKFQQLHQYACNPENFWPEVREKIKTIPQAFDEIQKNDALQWVDHVVFVSDDPGKNDGTHGLGGGGNTTNALIKLVKEANTSIVIQSPYLVTTHFGKKLFKGVIDRKVSVKVMTNSLASTDNLQAFSGYQRDRNELLATGIKIYEYKPDAPVRYKLITGALQKKNNFSPIFGLHAKTMVIDGKITVIGTFNLDPRSANLNTECITIIYSEKIARNVLKEIEEELKPENCWETTVTYNPDKEAGLKKNVKTRVMKVVPKDIL